MGRKSYSSTDSAKIRFTKIRRARALYAILAEKQASVGYTLRESPLYVNSVRQYEEAIQMGCLCTMEWGVETAPLTRSDCRQNTAEESVFTFQYLYLSII